jgi:excisionase family DNA binding protein
MATKSKGELITQTEAAELRGVTVAAINELIKRGRLKAVEMYGRSLVYRSEVEAFEPKTHKSRGKKAAHTKKGSKK